MSFFQWRNLSSRKLSHRILLLAEGLYWMTICRKIMFQHPPPLCNQLVYQNTQNFAQDLSQYFTHLGKNKGYVFFWVALYFVFFSPEVMPFIVLFWQNAKWYKKASSNLRKNHLPGVDASNVCFFMCLFKPRDTLHVKSHLLQAKGCSPVCESLWYLRLLEYLQEKLHWLHANGFSPECCRMCLLRWPARLLE